MLKRTVSTVMLTLLLLSMLMLASDIQLVKAEPKTWTVDVDRPADPLATRGLPRCDIINTDLPNRKTMTSEIFGAREQTLGYSMRLDNLHQRDVLEPRFVPGEIIVRFKSGIDVELGCSAICGIKSIDELSRPFKAMKAEKIFPNVYKLTLPRDVNVSSAAREFMADPNIEYAEPSYIYHTCVVPNDPDYHLQWAHGVIESERAWDIETGDPDVVIAVVDTGVDWDHPDLAANIWNNKDEVIDGIDNDGNGFIDDVRGYDFVHTTNPVWPGEDGAERDNDPMDFHGHGTHCAGIVAAVTNNGVGIAGVGWNCKIMPVRAGYKGEDGGGYFEIDDVVAAITYAVDNGARIISMSWGDYGASALLWEAVKYAYDRGVLMVAAAGNEETSAKFYPAAFDEVVAVTATNRDDESAWFTNFGDWVEVAAPGVGIYSTVWDDSYQYMNGTSMSTPHVAGVAALVWSRFPNMTRDRVRLQLRHTADDLGDAGFDVYYGYGRINARRAVEQAPANHDLLIAYWEKPRHVKPGSMAKIYTTVFNFGTSDERNIEVQLLVNGSAVDSTFISNLISYTSAIAICAWSPTLEGTYNVTSYVVPVQGEAVTWNNALSAYITVRQTIQDAINAATPGDTIYVRAGTYYENVVVNKTVSLVGESPANTIIDGEGFESVVTVIANDVLVANFTIQRSSSWWDFGAGVLLSNSNNTNIQNNNVTNSFYISNSFNDTLASNIIGSFVLSCSPNNRLRNNSFSAFGVYGDTCLHFIQDIDSSNTIHGKPIYYWVERENGEIPSDAGYVALINSTNIRVRNLNLWGSYQGIMLFSTSNTQILNNNITNCIYGIILSYSSNNIVSENNIIINGWGGIGLFGSSNNTIYHNNFIKNTNQAYIYDSANLWDDGYPSGGNYWSDYAGVDKNGDDIGDTSYTIDAVNVDRFPLIEPWKPPLEHELVVFLDAPISLLPGYSSMLRVGVANKGLNNETNVELFLLINEVTVKSVAILLLQTNSYNMLSYNWTPAIEGMHDVTAYSPAVPGEENSANNRFTRFVRVKKAIQVPDEYITIQEAIRAAEETETVYVKAGTYYENVVVNKSLRLLGENMETTIIDGNAYDDSIHVSSDNIVIKGFTIKNGGSKTTVFPEEFQYSGVYLSNVTGCEISGNKIEDNGAGILLRNSDRNTISENAITGNEKGGILLYGSSNNIMSANNVTNNMGWNAYGIDITYSTKFFGWFTDRYSDYNTINGNNVTRARAYGIRLRASFYNTLTANTVTNNSGNGICMETSAYNILRDNNIAGNQYNFGVFTLWDEVDLSTYTQDIDSSNKVNGKPVYYLMDQRDLIIDSIDIGYLALINCTNIRIKGVTLANSGQGLLLAFTSNSRIEKVTLAHNRVGIHILNSDTNSITANNVIDNGVGINLYRASFSNITENTITNNGVSIGSLVIGDGVLWTSRNIPSEDNIISNNRISHGGISLSGPGTTGTLIVENNITGDGIRLDWHTNANVLTGNNITNGYNGITLDGSANNLLRNNKMANNTYNFMVEGGSVSDFINNVDVSNTVDGKPIYYWINKQDKTVPLDAGSVALVNSYNVTVKGLQLKNNGQGVLLANSTTSQITNNNITNNQVGIELFNSTYNSLSKNNIANNYCGFLLTYSSNNTLTGNLITTKHYCGIALLYSDDNTLASNNMTDNQFSIGLIGSSHNTLIRNNITNNEYGIDLEDSSNDNTLAGNTITDNRYRGITLMYSSNNNTLIGNTITNTNYYGIWLAYSSIENKILSNIIMTNKEDGIRVEYSSNNTIYHNNFINNTIQAYTTNSVNVWDDGYPSGGNYWSNYTGVDADVDGIGDTPYIIDADNQDRYPLMTLIKPWTLLCDINSDGVVSILDLATAAVAYGSYPGHPKWNPTADLDGNDVINILDIVIIAKNFGRKW